MTGNEGAARVAVVHATMTVDTLRDLLEQRKPVAVLDVRTAADRAEWAIPGSIHVDAYDRLKAHDPTVLVDLDLPGDRPVVTVCGVGRVAAIAAEQLRSRGIQAVTLFGGMKAWSLAWNTAEVALRSSEARVIQVRRTGKGCLSYLVGTGTEAAVIDASLAPEVYVSLARHQGWTITSVLDTHLHADHLSRSRALAEATGATHRLPVQERVSYPFAPLREGDVLELGAARLTVWHTPGHTLESASYLLDEQALFTGDTLFLAGVGRPDLEASAAEARGRAHALYRSLQRLLVLPPETLILPAHTSSPVAFDRQPIVDTLATVRARIPALQAAEDAFVETILARIPPTPPNHSRIVALNEAGLLPEGDPTELEAGANRCAVS